MKRAILNLTRHTRIAANVEIADSVFRRFKGLMFRPALLQDSGLWLSPCKGIHSCFMEFQFDAVFLDEHLRVLHVIKAMKPWRICGFVKGAKSVLELPEGCITRSQTEVGDQLEWQADI
jgi:uncharacterized membrane protein (UPF0127 family)